MPKPFQRDQAVDTWCQDLIGHQCQSAPNIDELKDHLHCEIDRLVSTGLSEQRAFLTATRELGEPDALVQEYTKNRRWRTIICAKPAALNHTTDNRHQPVSQKKEAILMIVHSLIWATMMIGSSLILVGTEQAATMMQLIFAGWFVSFMLTQNMQDSARAEYICLKGKFMKLVGRA
ncbi:MAG: permease prefix domain 1-containing protein [Pseudomonadota bacterium]